MRDVGTLASINRASDYCAWRRPEDHRAVVYMQDRPPGTVYRDERVVLAAFAAMNTDYALPSQPYAAAKVSDHHGQCSAGVTGNGSDGTAPLPSSPTSAILRTFDEAMESIAGVGPLVAPVLGPMWTSQLRWLLIVVRSAVEVSGPRLLDHLRIPFLDGMNRLQHAETTLRMLDYCSCPPAAQIEPKPQQWSQPMTRKEARRRLGGASASGFRALLDRYGFDELNRQSIRIRLDTMDDATRRRFETAG